MTQEEREVLHMIEVYSAPHRAGLPTFDAEPMSETVDRLRADGLVRLTSGHWRITPAGRRRLAIRSAEPATKEAPARAPVTATGPATATATEGARATETAMKAGRGAATANRPAPATATEPATATATATGPAPATEGATATATERATAAEPATSTATTTRPAPATEPAPAAEAPRTQATATEPAPATRATPRGTAAMAARLRELLAAGPRPRAELHQQLGAASSTLYRASKMLGIISERIEGGSGPEVRWRLPEPWEAPPEEQAKAARPSTAPKKPNIGPAIQATMRAGAIRRAARLEHLRDELAAGPVPWLELRARLGWANATLYEARRALGVVSTPDGWALPTSAEAVEPSTEHDLIEVRVGLLERECRELRQIVRGLREELEDLQRRGAA